MAAELCKATQLCVYLGYPYLYLGVLRHVFGYGHAVYVQSPKASGSGITDKKFLWQGMAWITWNTTGGANHLFFLLVFIFRFISIPNKFRGYWDYLIWRQPKCKARGFLQINCTTRVRQNKRKTVGYFSRTLMVSVSECCFIVHSFQLTNSLLIGYLSRMNSKQHSLRHNLK